MSNISSLKAQVGQIGSIKEITQAMADIATSQIKQRRATAERNIRYFREIFGEPG
jgi:F0F1-type ATP synthase gamma subunit